MFSSWFALSFKMLHVQYVVLCVWRIGIVDAFHPKGHEFDSRSSRHLGTLGKYVTHSYLWRFGMKFRYRILAVSGVPLSSQSINQSSKQSSNQSINQSINQSSNQYSFI